MGSSSTAFDDNQLSKTGSNDHMLQLGCLKAMVDGSLGTHTAAFFDSYIDSSSDSDRGHLIWDPVILEAYIQDASENDLQVMVHAIGDRANRVQLDIFERVSKKLARKDLRFRIEHAQHIHPDDIERFGKLGIVASMQMSHLSDDGRWAGSVIGQKRLVN
jgi:predicted amidohydrolase YtcJ